MLTERLQSWTEPHSSVTELHTARVLKLVATWHLITVPLGPLLAAFQVLAGEPERVRALWLFYAPVATFINFLLTRSRYGPQALWLQVASSFVLVVASIGESPDRVAPLMALFLPVLAAALAFESKEVLYVQLAALAVVVVRVFQSPVEQRGYFIGIGVVMLSGFIIIWAIVRHRVWLMDQRVKQLLDETRRARAILEASFDGTAHVVGGVFESVSEGFSKVLAREGSALVGRAVNEVLPVALASETGREDAIPFINGDGALRYATVVHQVLDAHGAGSGVIAIRDMSEAHMHRAKLQFTERLAATGFLASGVAHEVNNALMSLSGQCELGARALERGEPERASRSLAAIALATERIADCVRELKRFGSRSSDKTERFDLNELVDSTMTLASYRVQHVAKLRRELGDGPLWTSCAEGGVSQILMNLLFNATDALRDTEGAEIVVSTCVTDEGLCLRVCDNGPGIAPSDVSRVFEPFYTTKAAGEGSGLGLSISAHIAAKNGGALRYLEQARGACFELVLPHATEDEAEDGVGGGIPEASASLRVLIIDDEAEILEVLSAYLHPAQVVTASSAERARERFSEDFDLVICDVLMPDENGLRFREWVEREHPTMLERLILMTGSAVHLEEELESLGLGERVLAKPISRQALLMACASRLSEGAT